MPLSHILTNLDDARDTLVNSINSRGGNLEESATLYQCAAAVNALASGVLSINGHLPDESGSVTIPDATQSASGLMSAADKVKLDAIISVAGQSGYMKFPNSIVMQWGIYNVASDPETREITLPVATYVTFCRFINSDNLSLNLSIAGASTGKIMVKSSGASSGLVYWMVIGSF